jgi:predicted 3-demethylubiquinone-9 3-methyltransferase (glyoxalase superfamily)
MQKITPFLWFDAEAEEAYAFYASVFPGASLSDVQRTPEGRLLTAVMHLEGQDFMVLNGGPEFEFTEAISFFVSCESQEEVDRLWDRLTADGGEESQCGWLKDKYGLSWQIVPTALGELMADHDPEKAGRVMQAMLQMSKIDIAGLRAAYDA